MVALSLQPGLKQGEDVAQVRTTTRLKSILARRNAALLPGAANALFARIVEDLGFEACYVTGAGIANMHLGAPDIGLTTLAEIVDHVAAMADAVAIPLLVDADTGFGNALNVIRTVTMLERAGAAGIQLEDQVFPKRCGHFDGKEVVPLPEMLGKVRAAVDARRDRDFQIVARTDARSSLGLDAALERAHAMIEAGADATFVEAPTSHEEIARILTELPAPQIVNIVFGGRTPEVPQPELAKMGAGECRAAGGDQGRAGGARRAQARRVARRCRRPSRELRGAPARAAQGSFRRRRGSIPPQALRPGTPQGGTCFAAAHYPTGPADQS